MNFIDQNRFNDLVLGTKGNCLQACLASLFSLELDQVPDFTAVEGDWVIPFEEFIESQGYTFEGAFSFDNRKFPKTWEDLREVSDGIDGVFIASGVSPRNPDITHAVLYSGGCMIHDPHPSRAGIVSLRYAYLIEKPDENKH